MINYFLPIDENTTHYEGFAYLRKCLMASFMRTYAVEFASRTVLLIDLVQIGHIKAPEKKSPVQETISTLRTLFNQQKFGTDLNLKLEIYLLPKGFLIRKDEKKTIFDDALAQACIDAADEAELELRLSSEEVREIRNASRAKKLGDRFNFDFLNCDLPALKEESVLKYLPSLEERVANVVRRIQTVKRSKDDAQGERAKIRRTLVAALRLEDIKVFRDKEARQKVTKRTPKPRIREVVVAPEFIDYIDIIKARNGQLFIACFDAGLIDGERVKFVIQENQISIIQANTQYGQVMNVSQTVMNLLKITRQIFLVEIQRIGETRQIKAQHQVILFNQTLDRAYDASLMMWASSANKAGGELKGLNDVGGHADAG